MAQDNPVSRRRIIRGLAVGGAASIAGCTGGGNGSGGDGSGNGSSNQGGSSGNNSSNQGNSSGNGSSGQGVEFTAWSFGPNFPVMQEAAKAWEKDVPHSVTPNEIDGGVKPWTSALQVQSGLPGYGLIQYPAYRSAATNGGLENLNDVIYPKMDQLIDSAISATHVGGNFFAFPHSINPVTLIYNKSMFEDAGLPGNPQDVMEQIQVYDDLIQAGEQMKSELDANLLVHGASNIRPPNALFTQLNGGFYNKEGEFQFDQEPNLKAMKICKSLQPYGANLDLFGNTIWEEFKNENIASFLVPGWYINFIQEDLGDMSGQFRMIQLPATTEGGPRGATAGGAPETIPIAKDSSVKEAARQFGEYRTFTKESYNRKLSSYIFPANTVDNAEVLNQEVEFFGGQTIFSMIQKTLEVSPPQDSAPSQEVDLMYQEAYRKIMAEDAPIQETMTNTNEQMLQAIDDSEKSRMTVEEVRNQA